MASISTIEFERVWLPPPLTADVIRKGHRANGWLAFGYGFLVNTMLLVLLARCKVLGYRRLLLQMTLIDSCYLMLAGLVDPIAVFVDGIEIAMPNGFLRRVPQPWSLYLMTLWIVSIYFTIFRHYRMSKVQLLSFLMLPMLAALTIGVFFLRGYEFDETLEPEYTRRLAYFLLESGESSIYPAAIASTNGNLAPRFIVLLASSMVILNYAIIIFCVIRIDSTLTELAPHLRSSTRALHKQLSIVLFVQAALPLLVMVVPLFCLFWVMLTQATAFYSLLFLACAFNWIPSVNASVTLICVKKFRRRLHPRNLWRIWRKEPFHTELESVHSSQY